jgi:heavy metal sensor kinase
VRRWWRSHNVRVRLTFWYLIVMILVLVVYDAAVFAFIRRGLSDTLDQRLRGDFQWAAAMVDRTPEGRITWYEDETATDDERPWLQVWSTDGQLLYRNEEAELRPVPESRQLAVTADGRPATLATATVPIRVLSRKGSIGTQPVVIQVARSEGAMRQQLRALVLIFLFGLPAAVATSGLGGYVLARRALAPVERMTERARTITPERLRDRLPVHNPDDEMGRLAVVFNETLGRLEQSFEQMRRFTADVSHELRTPLTSIRSVGEVGLRGQRDEHAYRAIIGSMLEEADRLASLVDRLLTLSRSETGQESVTIEPLDLRELAENVAGHLGVLAEEQRQTIVVETFGRPRALADRMAIRQALINLVDNAIKFSAVGGRILIQVAEEGDRAVVDVVDSGPGIAVETRERIFDRFYRATTDATGTGLGLSIARGAVEANSGRLALHRTGPEGSTFRMTLPTGQKAQDGSST